MTLDEYMRNEIHELTVKAAEIVANNTDDPDLCAQIPFQFFRVENELVAAWVKVSNPENDD